MSEKRRDGVITLPVTLSGSHNRVWGLASGVVALFLIVLLGRTFMEVWGLAPDAGFGIGLLILGVLVWSWLSYRTVRKGTRVDAEGITVKRLLRDERIALTQIDRFDIEIQPTARIHQWQVRAWLLGGERRVVLSQLVYDATASVSVTGKSYGSVPVEAPNVIHRGFKAMRAAHRAAVGRQA